MNKSELKAIADRRELYFRTVSGEQFRASNTTFHRDGSVSIFRTDGKKHRFTEGTFYEMAGDLATLPLN